MKIGIIIGSHRAHSQSTKVGTYIQSELEKTHSVSTYVFDLKKNPLPLWSEDVGKPGSKHQKLIKPIKSELKSCDGFVIISPEWSGMVTPGLKNFFLHMSKNELGHKPALIVTVSATRGGSYPVAELRMSSYKNTRILYIPEHIIIQHVESVLNEKKTEADNAADTYIRERLTYVLALLTEYTKLLKPLQSSPKANHPSFEHGM